MKSAGGVHLGFNALYWDLDLIEGIKTNSVVDVDTGCAFLYWDLDLIEGIKTQTWSFSKNPRVVGGIEI